MTAGAHRARLQSSDMKRLTHHLYFWVLVAIIAGGLFGHFDPERAVKLKPLRDGFIALVKMLIRPVIFCTVVLGIAGAGDMRKVGRVGAKALLYFEIVSTFALVIGLLVVNMVSTRSGLQRGSCDTRRQRRGGLLEASGQPE